MSISESIQAADERFRLLLEDFFLAEWGTTELESHGIEHHRRVWHFASELLREIPENYFEPGKSIADGLIIASYLHDLGMSVDTGIRHGKKSSELCRKFLESNGLNGNEYADIPEAIEKHDNKEYTGRSGKFDLATLLSVADDLDAFGYEGIYRYLEIYRMRGIADNEIVAGILENATKRFLNFESLFKENNALVERHRKRFRIIENFFNGKLKT